jgi:hypothetical protein
VDRNADPAVARPEVEIGLALEAGKRLFGGLVVKEVERCRAGDDDAGAGCKIDDCDNPFAVPLIKPQLKFRPGRPERRREGEEGDAGGDER